VVGTYAIATGNCVVVKPSPEVPLSHMRLAELVEESGLPPGVWNVVNGDRDAVSALLDSPAVSGITFVGRTSTARDVICKRCGETGKRVIAQGSAKNFMVIMPDCNVEKTIPAMMTSFFGNAGQRCLSGANLLVVGNDDRFYHDFVEKIVAAASNIVIGYGLDESVQMGPVRDKDKKQRILADINNAVAEGAKVLLDGRAKAKIKGDYPETCFLGPTILENIKPNMRICKEEVFGPVMGVMRAADLDEAIEICNASRYGNGNAIFTSSGKSAREFQYRATSGNVGINVGIVAPMAFFPFSGMKDSFFGILHTQGQEAVRFFTESKVVIQRGYSERKAPALKLHTASEVISLARQLETDTAAFYELLGRSAPAGADMLLGFAKENRRNIAQVERAYYSVISDAIEVGFAFDIEEDDYSIRLPENAGLPDSLKTAAGFEDKIERFYSTAATQGQSLLADVPRVFKQIAQKHTLRIEQLRRMAHRSTERLPGWRRLALRLRVPSASPTPSRVG